MTHLRKTLLILVLSILPAAAARAEQRVLVLDPAASRVSFTLPATGHEVDGTLGVKSGRIAFDPSTGAASGEIAIDLKSAQTGNGSRDKTMHNDVLQTGSFPVAVFRAERVRGTVAASGASQVTLDGTLSLHGSDHKVSLPAKVEVKDGRVKAETRLSIPFVDWGMKDPSVLFLRVEKVVSVKVVAEGRLEGGDAAPAAR